MSYNDEDFKDSFSMADEEDEFDSDTGTFGTDDDLLDDDDFGIKLPSDDDDEL